MPVNGKLAPTIITIFGASGDLAKRKLVPALFNLFLDKSLPEKMIIIGIGREGSDDLFRENMKAAIQEFSRRGKQDTVAWAAFEGCLTFIAGTFEDPTTYASLAKRISETEKHWGTKAIRVTYLSTPPS